MEVSPADARFEKRDYAACCDRYYTVDNYCDLIFDRPEDYEIFTQRQATYLKKLATWEAWEAEHHAEIVALLADREEAKVIARLRAADRAKRAVERERELLQKRLRTLEKRLRK